MANQYDRKELDELVLRHNPKDPVVLQTIKNLDMIIRANIRNLQGERDPIRRTPRTQLENGLMETRYYAPKGSGHVVKDMFNANKDKIDVGENRTVPVTLGLNENVPFKTITASINDPAVRARIIRDVKTQGGYATVSNGLVNMEIPENAMVTGTKGQPVALTRSIASRIASANRKKAEQLSSFLSSQGYEDRSATENANIDRYARGKLSEKQVFYARQRRRSRQTDLMAKYEADNPDDPLVKKRTAARKKATRKKRAAAVKGGVGLVSRMVMGVLSSVLGGIMLGVGILKSIGSTVQDIGTRLRKNAMSERRFNFADNVVTNWERVASSKGIKEGALGEAAAALQDKFIDPLHYKGGAFEQVAPYFKEYTARFTDRAQAGGDENMLAMISDVLDVAMSKTTSGEWGSKSGLTRGEAYEGWYKTIQESFGNGMAEIFQAMYADFTKEARPGGYGSWYETYTDAEGKQSRKRMTASAYLSQADWMDRYKLMATKGLGIANDYDRANFEDARQAISSFATLLKSIGTDALSTFGLRIKETSKLIETKLINMLVKLFPDQMAGLATTKNLENVGVNAGTELFIEATQDLAKERAGNALRDIGLTGDVDETVQDLGRKGGIQYLSRDKRMRLTPETMAVLATYDVIQQSERDLEKARQEGKNGEVIRSIELDEDSLAQKVKERMQSYQSQLRKAAQMDVYVAATKITGGNPNQFAGDYSFFTSGEIGSIDEYMKISDKRLADFKKSLSYKWKSKKNKEAFEDTALTLQLYALAQSPGKEEEAAEKAREIAAFRTKDMPTGVEKAMAQAKIYEDLRKEIKSVIYATMDFTDINAINTTSEGLVLKQAAIAAADSLIKEFKPRMIYSYKDEHGNTMSVNEALPTLAEWLKQGNQALYDVDTVNGNSVVYIKFQQLDDTGKVIRTFNVGQVDNKGFTGDTVINANNIGNMTGERAPQ